MHKTIPSQLGRTEEGRDAGPSQPSDVATSTCSVRPVTCVRGCRPAQTSTSSTGAPMTTLTVLPLLQTLREFARDPDLLHLHDPAATERQWTELITTDDLQIWLISWPTGAETGWHDHGTAGGAFATIAGRLTEPSWDGAETLRDRKSTRPT